MMNSVIATSAPARDSTRHRFRLAVVAASIVAAIVGTVLLATHHSGDGVTTRGVTATLHVPGHPGWVAVGRDVVPVGPALVAVLSVAVPSLVMLLHIPVYEEAIAGAPPQLEVVCVETRGLASDVA